MLFIVKIRDGYPPSRKTTSVNSGMKANNFSLLRDFAPDEV